MKYLTYALLGLTLFLLFFGVLFLIMRRRYHIHQRLTDIQVIEADSENLTESIQLTGRTKEESPLFYFPLLGSYLKKSYEQMTQAHLFLKASEFLLISLLVAFVFLLVTFALTGNLAVSILPAVLGFYLPKLYISSSQEKRKKQLNNQLPEFLNILSNALRAGLSFNQAIATAGDEMADPIRWEFQKVMRDNSLGRPMEEALQELSVRTGDEDIDMLVSAIIIQRQVGGNMSEVLDMIANTIRERVKLKGEIRTMSAQNKMSAIIIGVLPIAIGGILSILNPGYITPLFTEPLGQVLIIGAGFMMIMGVIFLKKITTLEV
ncbi:type II secretion system F family protein [Clostridiaceae bacterium HFYG-1003]|nr:type II secretion system F family protein [Clostridiaceae bacterium HFYG-1003]